MSETQTQRGHAAYATIDNAVLTRNPEFRGVRILRLACLSAVLLTSACDQLGTPARSRDNSIEAQDRALRNDVATIEANVVRSADAQRLNELEQRISKLENTPQRLELDLLNARVQELEMRSGTGSDVATPIVQASPTAQPAFKRPPQPRLTPTGAAASPRAAKVNTPEP